MQEIEDLKTRDDALIAILGNTYLPLCGSCWHNGMWLLVAGLPLLVL